MSASLRRSRRSRSATITRRRSGEHLARHCWSCPLSASTALMAVHPAAACCAIGTVLSIGQPVRAHQWTCSRRRLACARRYRWIRRWHPMRWQLVCCSSRDESLLISNPHDVDYTIGTIDSDDSGIDSEHRKQRRATFSRHRAHHHARLPQCCTCGMKGEHRAARNAAQNPPLFAYPTHPTRPRATTLLEAVRKCACAHLPVVSCRSMRCSTSFAPVVRSTFRGCVSGERRKCSVVCSLSS